MFDVSTKEKPQVAQATPQGIQRAAEKNVSQNAKDFSPSHGLLISVTGPPGSGKSHFARSAIAAIPGAKFLFVAPAAELMSYAGTDIDYEQLIDPEWSPAN